MRRTAAVGKALLALLLLAAVLMVASLALGATGAPNLRRGVVDVTTNLAYQNASAAGTGMVLTSSGVVLTNNHVIRGATTIRVVDPSTHRSYAATVLGYSTSADVAVLKLSGAPRLTTVRLGDSSKLRVNQPVTAVGNARGRGTLTASAGRITALRRTITARDNDGNGEQLTGLIATDAGLEPGDSGGPLLDASGRVIGMDTAASSSFVIRSGGNDGYAIPINRALSIAKQIEAGRGSASIHIGDTAFLGVSTQTSSYYQGDMLVPAPLVVGVVPNSPADQAGLAAGDLITSLDGQPVDSPTTLASRLLQRSPGATVQLSWVDQSSAVQSGTVTLASGPPQ